ncbi:MAG: flagellar export chaperone FliS [Deltaproteobacteria bacterium]|nr:flagellar export chaperone FliS [Deltaproteobacteria bacterium]
MNSLHARNAYRQSEAQSKIHPVKLIHLMYERTLVHLDKAMAGIAGKDPKKRGEHLGKAIAIIAELNASVKEDDNSEAALFLRGLYGAILLELPKAAINNDAQILGQTFSYIKRLKEIWEETAMKEMLAQQKGSAKDDTLARASEERYAESEPKAALQGVSFSI